MRQAIFGIPKGKIELDLDWDFADSINGESLHYIHPYPARFISEIPRQAINMWSNKGDLILDPFCGSGTTLLEASLNGRVSIGVDNNAVGVLISKTKTKKYTANDIKKLEKFAIEIPQNCKTITPSTLNYKNIDYWFEKDAINDLGKIKSLIGQLSGRPRDFAMAIFSAIIVNVSNQHSDTRYVRIKKNYNEGDAITLFSGRLVKAIHKLKKYYTQIENESQVYLADSRNLSFINNNSVKLIVTSPPYLNTYDYHKYHRHRIEWIEANVPFARDKEIGKHDYFTRPGNTADKYFEDMQQCFKEWYRVLQDDGRVLIVVGDGIVHKQGIPVGIKFTKIMENLGFVLEANWIRKLDISKKSFSQNARITKEHVLLFQKEIKEGDINQNKFSHPLLKI